MWLKADEQAVGELPIWSDSYDNRLMPYSTSLLQQEAVKAAAVPSPSPSPAPALPEGPTVAVVDSPTSIRVAKFGTDTLTPLVLEAELSVVG